MNLRRFLRPEAVRLELGTKLYPEGDLTEDFDPYSLKNLERIREELVHEFVELFEATGEVANPSRLFKDLLNREKKASTAAGQGIALPHVRTLQLKGFVMIFGRSCAGLPFFSPDNEPVHLFFGMAAPPYDDRTYLRVYSTLSKLLLEPGQVDEFMKAEHPSEILRAMEVAC
jgi:mannitol/fructose-specific phosphotransferase system IIA component (Ntr-type)